MAPRSTPPKRLGSVLQGLIDQLGIRGKLKEASAVDAWYEVAGPSVAAVTDSAWMSRGRLFVKITSPTWRHELSLQREEWKARINKQVGSEVVREIVFR